MCMFVYVIYIFIHFGNLPVPFMGIARHVGTRFIPSVRGKDHHMLHLNAKPIELKLTTPFRISRGVEYTAPNVIIQVTHNEFIGYGEAAPNSYYGETTQTVQGCLSLLADHLGDDPFLIDDLHHHLDSIIRLNPSVKAAVDMA